MTTFQEFLSETERAGKFSSRDMMYLARVGFEALLPDVHGPAQNGHVQAEEPDIEQEVQEHYVRRVWFGVDLYVPKNFRQEAQLETIQKYLLNFTQHLGYAPQLLVVGSREGLEVVAACSGTRGQGQNISAIFNPTPHESEALAQNLNNPLCAHVQAIYEDPNPDAFDAMKMDCILICRPTTQQQILSWFPRHLQPNGHLVVVGANNLVNEMFPNNMAAFEQETNVATIPAQSYIESLEEFVLPEEQEPQQEANSDSEQGAAEPAPVQGDDAA